MRRLLLFVVQLFVVDALPWLGATPTPSPTPCHGGTSQIVASPTPPPRHHDLVKRNLDSNVCGWVNGNESLCPSRAASSSLTNGQTTHLHAMTHRRPVSGVLTKSS